MSQLAIAAALEGRLASVITDGRTIVWENQKFSPRNGEAFIKVKMITNPTVPAGFGHNARQYWSGLFQISLFYPIGVGAGEGRELADQLVTTHFARGTTLTSGSIQVLCEIGTSFQGISEPDWWSIPVRIPYFSYI